MCSDRFRAHPGDVGPGDVGADGVSPDDVRGISGSTGVSAGELDLKSLESVGTIHHVSPACRFRLHPPPSGVTVAETIAKNAAERPHKIPVGFLV